ncbi:MAG: hypothetical protein KDJ27_07390 [Gammaproteobacteria bacterium]|nr:hypothetical protein [Gammaproteobacteria bacterium]MCB1923563.1 hypothetical protein [Gammaproteobacteria bacterium]
MEKPCESLYKRREIAFCTLHPDPQQARSAATFLGEIKGVSHVEVVHKAAIEVQYLLVAITLAEIEDLLVQNGFHLDNRLMHKIKRALYHYTEDTQRANLGCNKGDPNCTEKVFVNRYRNRDHGCQDDRPDHWRRYL